MSLRTLPFTVRSRRAWLLSIAILAGSWAGAACGKFTGDCKAGTECWSGKCVFRTAGCNAVGQCWDPNEAWPPGAAAPYCGCDGKTFGADLPTQPFSAANFCQPACTGNPWLTASDPACASFSR